MAMAIADTDALSNEEIVEAIGAYGALVAEVDLDAVLDERSLPYPKDTMIEIFLAALATVDDAAVKESLRQSYFQLAQFLPNIAAEGCPTPARAQELARRVESERERLAALYAHTLGEAA
jgi:hypothetical protein